MIFLEECDHINEISSCVHQHCFHAASKDKKIDEYYY